MKFTSDLNVFLNPKSVAVIGASERPGSWGGFIMEGLLSVQYPGKIYPVNHQAERVFDLPCYRDIRQIKEPVDLAVIAIPQQDLAETIAACGKKGVKGITVITAGFAETSDEGGQSQAGLAGLARSMGMRMLGPNVSGTFNLHGKFNASSSSLHSQTPCITPIAALCQGGFAMHDLFASAGHRKMGLGKFIHTGNEADLTVTDFMEYFGQDPETQAIVMYIETIRDIRRFMEVARRVNQTKPVVIYKGGRTEDSARAAQSHTGALSSKWQFYEGLFRQTGVVLSPAMELLLPLAHALIERPPMRGIRTAIVTMGGSWGVALTDCLVESGLRVPEFSPDLQDILRSLGLPARASSKNPVDFGASGRFLETDFLVALGRAILRSGEVDAIILHGIGRAGMQETDTRKGFREVEKNQILGFSALEKETGIPVMIGNHHGLWESRTISDLTGQGVRIYDRLHDIAWMLSAMQQYWKKRLAWSADKKSF
ncbi:MAG: CoA-binding protein [Pseudomonadota bacterium]